MKKLLLVLSLCLLASCGTEEEPKRPDDEVIEEETPTVHFIGVGDNLIHETIYLEADRNAGEMNDRQYDFSPMYANVKNDISKADLAFLNQETILGGDDFGLSGYPTFNSPSILANQMAALGFDIVNTATNHTLDKGLTGVNNSIEAWGKEAGIVTAGTYASQEDRDTIRTITKNGITFSFLAYTYGTNGVEPPNAYSVAYFDKDKIREDVKKAKEVSDVVIVSAHWGNENEFSQSEYQKEYAQLFADLEVEVVIGTHPHVIQPVEWLSGVNGNKTLVTYSLGNFIGGMLEEQNILSGMVSFDFVKKEDKIEVSNVAWTPLVIHYEGDQNDILNTRYNYKIYKLSEYTDELASKHALQGFEGQTISVDRFMNKTKEVIGTEITIK